ncbi:MAG: membrane-bound lytic murein transglycosylase MltF [Epsilonproteobacteria bacterium]|nr:membrane-bound lytic murein transglycosylase MltF [Campylobacterota bacterium]
MKTLILLLFFLNSLYAQQTITVITRNAPTTLLYAADGAQIGFEHDLVLAFAKEKGYKVNFIIQHSIKEVLDTLKQGKGDFAAAGLTSTSLRKKEFWITPGYYTIQEQVVCGYKKRPKRIDDLQKYKIEIIAKSSYAETMQKLKKKYPFLYWDEHEGYTTEHIFEQIDKKKIDCTIADSNIIAINRRYFPHLHVAFAVSEQQHLSWIFPKKRKNFKLYKEVSQWLIDFKKTKHYKMIKERYFAYTKFFDYVDLSVYHRRIKKLLPKYKASFQRAGKKYGIDWRLLAAQAYQESHWNPRAKSPTGVRGMMMLTRATAKQLGVTNRLNYRHSIEGGAKYMKNLLKRIPKKVKNRADRYKFALAAYNIGMGHLYDAIRLGKLMGKDPYNWMNMKKILPLLAQRKYYKKLRYGYARGNEPVRYVRRINTYYDILRQYYKN